MAEFDGSISDNIYVKGYYQNAFKLLGDAVDDLETDDAIDPSLALGNNNNPAIAWSEKVSGGSSDIFVGNFAPLIIRIAEPADKVRSHNTYEPSLKVEKSTTPTNFVPVIAFSEEVTLGNQDIYVRRWAGSWLNYGTGAPLDKSASNFASEPSLALDSTNKPYVAWTEQVGSSSNIYVKRWTGTAWAWVGGSAGLKINATGNAFQPSLAIGSNNIPIVAGLKIILVVLIATFMLKG